MIRDIIKGISCALYDEFGDGFAIYAEDVKQGLSPPCFFIQCINPKISRFRGNRYYRENQFAIQYFPESKNYREEMFGVIDRMYKALEIINVRGNKWLGKGIETAITDEVLTFVVNYDAFVYNKEEIEKMYDLTTYYVKKGGQDNGN